MTLGPMILVVKADLKCLCEERDVCLSTHTSASLSFTYFGTPKTGLYYDGVHLGEAGIGRLRDFLRNKLNDMHLREWLNGHQATDEQ